MSRYLPIVVLLGASLGALAHVRVFVTSSASGYGLDLLGPQGDGTGIDPEHEDWPIDPFRPTYSTVDWDPYYGWFDLYGYDYYYGYYRAAAYPPIDAPSGTPDGPILIDAAAGNWAYIWFQFRSEPASAQVNGFEVVCTLAGEPSGNPTNDLSFTYYVQNNTNDDGRKRWDGYAIPPDYPGWHANPFQTDQIESNSIKNTADDPTMLFENQAINGSHRTGVALLGALAGLPSAEVYELRIDYIDYSQPPYPTVGESCFFRVVPEPAAVLLLGILGIGARARRS